LDDRLGEIIRASPTLMRVLVIARELGFPDWRVVSGSIYQSVWNALTGRDPDYGIRDYDLFYFDGRDLSWDAEDLEIRGAAALFPADLSAKIEVRNQARVHLWFADHFGEAYAPLSSTDEAIARFVATANAVGVRLEPDGRLDIAAPFGLEDLFAMRLTPNPGRPLAKGWTQVIASNQARWPEVTVEMAPPARP